MVAIWSLIKRLLERGRERKNIREILANEMAEWGEGTSSTKDREGREILGEEAEAAIHIAEYIYIYIT